MKSGKLPHYSLKTGGWNNIDHVKHRSIMIGTQELIIISALVLLLFGASKLPELASSMGKSIGEFKKARIESEKEMKEKSEV